MEMDYSDWLQEVEENMLMEFDEVCVEPEVAQTKAKELMKEVFNDFNQIDWHPETLASMLVAREIPNIPTDSYYGYQ